MLYRTYEPSSLVEVAKRVGYSQGARLVKITNTKSPNAEMVKKIKAARKRNARRLVSV